MFYIIIYLVVFIAWMGVMLIFAPSGYEDENGFHYGIPKKILNQRKIFGNSERNYQNISYNNLN